MIYNIKKYKLAKLLVKDLAIILSTMIEYENKLAKYQKYSPIKKLIQNTKDNRVIIQHHLKKQKAIIATKGLEVEMEKLLPGEKNEKN